MFNFAKGTAETDRRNMSAVEEGFKMFEEREKEIQMMLRNGGVGSDVQVVRNEEKFFKISWKSLECPKRSFWSSSLDTPAN